MERESFLGEVDALDVGGVVGVVGVVGGVVGGVGVFLKGIRRLRLDFSDFLLSESCFSCCDFL